jgi:DNA (cytosine-5)-methyltransferase 1
MKGVSLFSSAGIAEYYLENLGIEIVVANELLEKRCELYRILYPQTNMICGDIRNEEIFDSIISNSNDIDFLIASPPCQGMSIAGKNRTVEDMVKDERNFLVERVIQFIEIKYPTYILIENVPSLLKFKMIHQGVEFTLVDLLKEKFSKNYNIEYAILNAKDYEVPQNRQRAIIKIYKKGAEWPWPNKKEIITVEEAIGKLPSLESGEKSKIQWHFARKHIDKHIVWMRNTPTGQSAFDNDVHYPQKENGVRIKGYNSSYRRIKWDEPAPTITMRNDAVSSQRNVHPGKKKEDGTYSDSRVLTPLELMILMSLPENWKIPKNTPETLIRQCLGEAIPPKMIMHIVQTINNKK